MKKIEYKGKILETALYKEMTEEEYEDIVNEYYTKPNFEEVKKTICCFK